MNSVFIVLLPVFLLGIVAGATVTRLRIKYRIRKRLRREVGEKYAKYADLFSEIFGTDLMRRKDSEWDKY